MKGKNTLEMNTATIKAAVQMYLDAQFAPGKAPTVEDVEPSSKGYTSGAYIVTLVSPEDPS